MTVAVAAVLALLLVIGVPVGYVVAAGVFAVAPPIGVAVGIAAFVWEIFHTRRSGTTTPGDEAAFLREMAASVQAGATLRQALLEARSPIVDDAAKRLCRSGAPMAQVGRMFRARLPLSGIEFAVVAELSETTGAAAGPAISVLAEESDNAARRQREQRVSVAQSKFSAVVGLVPLAAAVALVAVRGVPEPGGSLIVVPMVVGAAMMAIGSGIIFLMATRASR